MFVDEAKINVKGGDGGNGCNSTHREIYAPKGGPDGGNGGRGGNVILEGTSDMNTLIVFKKRVHIKAERGKHGSSSNKFGKDGEDTIVPVPLGTVVYDGDSGKFLGEIIKPGDRIIAARGGRGGRGNAAFATPNYRVPRFAEKGEVGEVRWIRLELRVLAHIGLVGMPNAGKSTLLSAITAAKPKIADYPFTTLNPILGVIEKTRGVQYVIADIPGLIEGASLGAGLGDRFLRHISRTKMLVHLIDLTQVSVDNPLENYNIIMNELRSYDPALAERPMIIAANKTDIPGTEEAFFALEKALKADGKKCFPISAASGEGLEELKAEMFKILDELGRDFTAEKPSDIQDYVVIDEESENLKHFTIEPVDDYFVVHGKNPERMVQMLDLENDEAVRYLQGRLKRMGIEKELKRLGAKEGDFVVIGNYEFNFFEDKEI